MYGAAMQQSNESQSPSQSMVWRLRPGADRRFRAGHPWVYSNELAGSPKGVEPGALIELRDGKDQFMARGYANPASLIAFRALSRDPKITEPDSAKSILESLLQAHRIRELSGLGNVSHRLCFGEADHIPGLIIDRYRVAPDAQVFVVQAHTAGAQRLLGRVQEVFQALVKKTSVAGSPTWEKTAIVLRNDVAVRKLEGLEEEAPKVLREASGFSLREAKILVAPALGTGKPMEFETDLLMGQKTGFFLDQFANIQLAAIKLAGLRPAQGKPLRILDLCCYVGQWGAQLARVFKEMGVEVEVTAVDASDKALVFARKNIEAQGVRCETIRGDVLKDLERLAQSSFDLVISDPPALIKGRKDIGPGTHAYLQLNTQVFRLVKNGGAVVSCSCSALLEEEEFTRVLAKAASRNGVDARWIGRGMQAPDHPMLTEFPEGRYLKAWIGLVSKGAMPSGA